MPVRLDVVRGDGQPLGVDLDAQQAVVEDVSAVAAPREPGPAPLDRGARAARRDAVAGVRGGVEDERGRAVAGQGAPCGVGDPVQLGGEPLMRDSTGAARGS
ncbi:hypothetical protein H4N64_19505 [Streptomyces sp. PSKA01]|uniref:Uncharacterized protein n=1 Tax=Streptomyces cupreus TaxID=2759956 RepID=A0A7X1J5Z1_9ACTN|nr:hypothetical protein [Streptomyces cupreus]